MVKPNTLLSTFYSVIATYVEFFFGLLISILIARHLAPEQYGVYGYLMWVSTLLTTLVNGGIGLGIIKFMAEARAKLMTASKKKAKTAEILSLHEYFRSLLFKKIFFYTVISCTVIFVIHKMHITSIDQKIWYITIIAAMFKAYHMNNVALLKGFEDFRSLAILSSLITPFNLALVVICLLMKQPLIAYVWVYFAVSIMYLIISYFLTQKNLNSPKSKKAKKAFRKQSIPLQNKAAIFRHVRTASWISILSFIVLRQSELFFLNIYSTAEVMAYFNVGYTLASAAMTLVPGVYSTILMPLMARVNQTENVQVENQLKLSLRYMLQLITALLFPVCFFAKEIFMFLYGPQYISAVFPFQVIIACVAFKTLSDCTNAYLWSQNKQDMMLKLIIVGSTVTIAFDYYFIKLYALPGALFAFSASTLLFIALNLGLVFRKLNTKLEWFIYFKTIFCGFIAILIVSPIGIYLPNIVGAILGGCAYVVIYILALLLTFSLSVNDVDKFRILNQRFLKNRFFEHFLVNIQDRTCMQNG